MLCVPPHVALNCVTFSVPLHYPSRTKSTSSFPCWTCIQTCILHLQTKACFQSRVSYSIQTVEAGSEKSAVELPGAPTLHRHAVPTGVAALVTLHINQSIPRGVTSHTGNKGWREVIPQIPLSTQQRCSDGNYIACAGCRLGVTQALEAPAQAL